MSSSYEYWIARQEEPQLAEMRGFPSRKLTEREKRAVDINEAVNQSWWAEKEKEYQESLKTKSDIR